MYKNHLKKKNKHHYHSFLPLSLLAKLESTFLVIWSFTFAFVKMLIKDFYRQRLLVRFKIALVGVLILFIVPKSDSTCATLHSNDGSISLELNENSIYGNIREEYISSDQSWNNITGTWTIDQSCELQTCSEPYFNGECSTISNGANSLPNNWQSARCTCQTECSCSNIFTKPSGCGRAYLETGGCNICNASYTELDNGSQDMFPESWSNKISGFVVKSGCNLTVFEEENFDGESETISGSNFIYWNRTMGSYECECPDHGIIHQTPATTESPQRSTLINIPDSIDDVITKYAESNFAHSGLQAVLSSLTRQRSSKNVYILMIGSSGAGKSSAINILLNTPNATVVGADSSTTSEILEFRIPIQLPNLGIANTELRIIDTPGIGDTRGLEYDARFLASLDEYLSNHEDLKTKIPNLVLIFHNFNDNRFSGEGAHFVRMIRALDNSVRAKFTDENYSNVLFVFSHLCSVDKQFQRNPAPLMLRFKEVIELFSFFPKPIMTAVIENQGQENELIMRSNNFELPNKELYPKNLFDKFSTITRNCQDKIGNALITSKTLRNPTNPFNITQITHPLVISNHNKVAKYLNLLTSTSFSFNNTEVSNSLTEAYQTMDVSIATNYPNSLENLQRYLNLKNIKSKSDVPNTSKDILELLSGIDQENPATTHLLETGLNLRAPTFPMNTMAGYSYDIRKNSILSVSPFRMNGILKPSSIGFLLPDVIQTTKVSIFPEPEKPVTTFLTFDSINEYVQIMKWSLLGSKFMLIANSTEIDSALTRKVKEGSFIKGMTCTEDSNMACFTVTRFYKIGQFDLKAPVESLEILNLESGFFQRLERLEPYIESSYENVETYTNFFNDFGTHVVRSADVGGRIDINFKLLKNENVDLAVGNVLKAIEYAEDPLKAVAKYNEDSKIVFENSARINHRLSFTGGNPAYHVHDISNMGLNEAYIFIQNWRKSIQFHPEAFPKEILPISDVILNYVPPSQKETIKEKIETALSRLLSSTLIYVEPTPDPKILEELERQRQQEENEERMRQEELERQRIENEKRLKQIELELRRKAEEAERLRLAEIEAQRQREQRERELQEQRRREAEEAERQRQVQEQERLRVLREQEERQRREREEARRRHLAELERIRQEEERNRERIRQAEEERRRREHENRFNGVERFFRRTFGW